MVVVGGGWWFAGLCNHQTSPQTCVQSPSPSNCNRSIFLQTKDMPTKGKIMFWHKSFGLLMGGAIVARIGAAIITRRPAAVPGPVYEQLAGKLTHAALCKISGWCGGNPPSPFHTSYVACDEWTTDGFMIFMPVSGIVMGYYRYTCDSHCLLPHPHDSSPPIPHHNPTAARVCLSLPPLSQARLRTVSPRMAPPPSRRTSCTSRYDQPLYAPLSPCVHTLTWCCAYWPHTAQVGYIMEWVIGAHVGAVIFHATRGQMIMNRILPGKSAAPTL